jgi:hypothetical protein
MRMIGFGMRAWRWAGIRRLGGRQQIDIGDKRLDAPTPAAFWLLRYLHAGGGDTMACRLNSTTSHRLLIVNDEWWVVSHARAVSALCAAVVVAEEPALNQSLLRRSHLMQAWMRCGGAPAVLRLIPTRDRDRGG